MVDYRQKLNINFDLSKKQIEILERTNDILVRAIPGSGKTTILTLKIKNLLIDQPNLNRLCCISYTNVNVNDLEESCLKKIDSVLVNKIDFLTFHRFCLEYILNPFSYLYRSNKGLRPYKTYFNFKEHGNSLINFLREEKVPESEINEVIKCESIYYNFKHTNTRWVTTSDSFKKDTVNKYLNFLNQKRMIDFNLINLLSLFIIQQNEIVRRAINKHIDWIFIDEFQDISEVQCKIIEELRADRGNNEKELKWFMVGDPNQSIYGFAGANPRSMYDMKAWFNNINIDNCEIKLDKTHRCSQSIFSYARKNYNNILSKIKNCKSVVNLNSADIINYLDDLAISDNVVGDEKEGDVIFKSTLTSVSEIINLKFTELMQEKVCCIGINRYNSYDVYKQYKIQASYPEEENFLLYIDLYKDYEEKHGKYFDLFIQYLILKYNFYFNRIKFKSSVDKFLYYLKLLINEKCPENSIDESTLTEILAHSCDLPKSIETNKGLSFEFNRFSENISEIFQKYFPNHNTIFLFENNKMMTDLKGIAEPKLQGFLDYLMKRRSDDLSFEIKYIHKIKGLEYDQVIVQRIEDLPHKANKEFHNSIFYGSASNISIDDIYSYIQELNKLYVMLTRSKNNLYIIIKSDKLPTLIEIG